MLVCEFALDCAMLPYSAMDYCMFGRNFILSDVSLDSLMLHRFSFDY